MPKITEQDVKVPMDVPSELKGEYIKKFLLATRNTGRLMLFAGDQKIEHLNDDFFGTTKEGIAIAADDGDPEHLFRIASKGTIGVFATQLGLIARYGMDYKQVPYIVKMNSKSHLVKTLQADPASLAMVDFEDVLNLKESGLRIVGIGYTVYLGSEYESDMIAEAARLVTQCHQHGMFSVLWMYPRGKAVPDEKDPHLIAGAAGVAVCLGSDFAKVNYPKKEGMDAKQRAESLKEAVRAAGRTRVLTAGGEAKDAKKFLQETYDQIHIGGAAGNATGRNIHQKALAEAVRMCDAVSAITLGDKDVEFAHKVFLGQEKFKG